MTYKAVVSELTVGSLWGPVGIDPELYEVTPGSNTVRIVGPVTFHKLGLDPNSRMLQLVRA